MAKKKTAIQWEIKRQQMANKILRAGAKSQGQRKFVASSFNRAVSRRVKQK
jgi:hypothetical protein